MVKLWRRYKPFINAGIQELITYRVNFILYRIGDVMGAFVAFYLWKAVFDSSQEPLIQGFSMADITFYIIKCHYFDENPVWARDCRSAGINCSISF